MTRTVSKWTASVRHVRDWGKQILIGLLVAGMAAGISLLIARICTTPAAEVRIDASPALSCGPIIKGTSRGVPPGEAGAGQGPFVYVVASDLVGRVGGIEDSLAKGTKYTSYGLRVMPPAVVNPGGDWNATMFPEPCRDGMIVCAVVSESYLDPGEVVDGPIGALARDCVVVAVRYIDGIPGR